MKYILVEENNVLTERRTFNQLGVVVSTPHMAMKFLAVNDTIITKRRTIFFFDNLLHKRYFAGNRKQDSTLERFWKNRSYIEERNIKLENKYNAIIKKGLPKKSKDRWSFNLLVSIGALFVDNALLDLEASVNIIPLAMLKKIGYLESKPTKMQLRWQTSPSNILMVWLKMFWWRWISSHSLWIFFIMDMKKDEEFLWYLADPLWRLRDS